jgi:hypothetical protein
MYTIIRFGLLYGLALVMGFYVSHLVLDTTPDNFAISEMVDYSEMIISSLAIIMGIKYYKQQRAPAPLGFMSGLGVGLGISIIAAHVFALYNWLYLVFINPISTTTYQQYSEQKIRSSGLSPKVIELQLADLADNAEFMSNHFTKSVLMFATVFIIGLLISVVSALVLPTPRNN